MRYIFFPWVLLMLNNFAYAMTEAEARIVRQSVLEICRGGSLNGKDRSIEVKGQGKITTVLFKKLAEAGLSGEAKFSQAEWDGIRPLLPENYDSDAYVKCVTELTPIFLAKFSSAPTEPPFSLNIVGKWAYDDGAHYWVVRPGPSAGYAIELYTSEDRLVGNGTATVNARIVNFTLRSSNHYIGDTLYMMHGETNGRLEYKGDKLTGQTDDYDLDFLNNPASIPTLTLHRAP